MDSERRFKTGRRRFGRFVCFAVAVIAAFYSSAAWAATIYVKSDAAGTSTGTSWTNAYPGLQSALARAKSGDEIWVAAGTYKPTTNTDRAISFTMKDSVNVYGGFAGTETTRAQRNWSTHETILTGDLGTTNSYHVVLGANGVFDGFTVTGGCANGSNQSNNEYNDTSGGGMYNQAGNPLIANCKFINNCGKYSGGLFSTDRHTTVTSSVFIGNISGGMVGWATAINCVFFDNKSDHGGGIKYGQARNCQFTSNSATYGGGAYDTELTNCVLIGNKATYGGGMAYSTATHCLVTSNSATIGGGVMSGSIVNCTIVNNTALIGGGYATNSSGLINSILWNNTAPTGSQIYIYPNEKAIIANCDIQGCGGSGAGWDTSLGTDVGGNISVDPQFVDSGNPAGPDGNWMTADDGMRLSDGSPCVNAGAIQINYYDDYGIYHNLEYAPTADILGNACVSGVPDVGAYEYQTFVPLPQLAVYDGSYQLLQNRAAYMGYAVVGSPPVLKTLTIMNTGTADLVTSPATTTSPFSIEKQPSRIAPGTSATLVVGMSTESAGYKVASVSFATNDPLNQSFQFWVSGSVYSPELQVRSENGKTLLNGVLIKMRTSRMGNAEPTLKLTLENDGGATLKLRTASIGAPFRITSAPKPELAPGARTTMTIAMDTSTSGTFSRTLTIPNTDPKNADFAIIVNALVQSNPKVLYVKADSKATTQTPNLGASWATAYPDLRWALADAWPGNEIWVAAGKYKPTSGTDRSISFVLPQDVTLHGGFAGTETSTVRDWRSHPSILSGDIGTSAATDNSYHVLFGGDLTVIDGFTIRDGYAGKPGEVVGGGMLLVNASPTIINCTFTNNVANLDGDYASGGAIYIWNSSPNILNCIFMDNAAIGGFGGYSADGGAISSGLGSPNLVNCIFTNNRAVYGKEMGSSYTGYCFGGAISEFGIQVGRDSWEPGSITLANCTFTSNSAVSRLGYGSALFADHSSCSVTGSIFWKDTVSLASTTLTIKCSDIQDPATLSSRGSVVVIDAGGNISADPKFLNPLKPAGEDGIWRTSDDGLNLQAGSPCINAGTPAPTPPTDITGKARIDRNDIGAYEYPIRNAAKSWTFYQ